MYEELYHIVILWWFEQNLLDQKLNLTYCKIFENFMGAIWQARVSELGKRTAKASLLIH